MPELATIHSEQRMALPLAGGPLQDVIVLTVSTPTVPPLQVYIDPAHDNEAERKAKIEAAIKAYRERKPNTLSVGP